MWRGVWSVGQRRVLGFPVFESKYGSRFGIGRMAVEVGGRVRVGLATVGAAGRTLHTLPVKVGRGLILLEPDPTTR